MSTALQPYYRLKHLQFWHKRKGHTLSSIPVMDGWATETICEDCHCTWRSWNLWGGGSYVEDTR